ncbi:MAG: Maf family protein [candidate division Zixibacteria bacterium]|nr:Maf family protein [candidate division Zixibacteria bacterium]
MTVQLPSFSTMTLPNLRRLAERAGLVLVSGSPRRREILRQAGIAFEVIIPDIDESIAVDCAPAELAVELARRKVESVARDGVRAYLGCDTIVVYDRHILNKPEDDADAMRMLTFLSGKTHSVFTGLVLCDSARKLCHDGVEESRVTFNHLDEQTLARYIATGEPLDKAGAYGIQGMGRFLVDSIEGNIDNVVGLPMGELERIAEQFWIHHV